jgi:hypothetical protein
MDSAELTGLSFDSWGSLPLQNVLCMQEDSWPEGVYQQAYEQSLLTPTMHMALLKEGISFVKLECLFRGYSNRPVGRRKL